MRAAITILALALAACATPQGGSAPDRVSVLDRPDGFDLTVVYERYQFIPETSAVLQACKSMLMATAHDVADRKGRAIEQINEQRIKISTGRNGFTGMTSCEASAPAMWKR